MQEYEKSLLINLLTDTGGNIRKAALQVDERRRTIYRMLKRHGLKPIDFRGLHADPR